MELSYVLDNRLMVITEAVPIADKVLFGRHVAAAKSRSSTNSFAVLGGVWVIMNCIVPAVPRPR